jgi:hypothetical protein
VTATDLSPAMLTELNAQTGGQVPTVLGDIRALPLTSQSYDAALAACVINHLDEPAGGIAELCRVTRPRGTVVTTSFGADDHPIKATVDDLLARHGFVAPEWYVVLKTTLAPIIATEGALVRVGARAGLTAVSATLVEVDLSDVSAEAAASYRLGLAHIAPFLQSLAPDARSALTAEVVDAVRALPPLRLPLLVLRGQSPG